ncbi:MAG: ComEC family competence protein, partial [Gramella sp.]|nr:ComEC family competence protein [Christiangramia sp.]
SRGTVLGTKHKNRLDIYSNSTAEHPMLPDYKRERNIDSIDYRGLTNIMNFSGKLTLIVDTIGNYKLKNFQPELLIIRNSPKINLDRLLKDLKPKKIIVDGSNYNSYVERWKNSALKEKIPFYHTGEKEAIINP